MLKVLQGHLSSNGRNQVPAFDHNNPFDNSVQLIRNELFSGLFVVGFFWNLHAVFVSEGKDENIPALQISMNAENLTVSWKHSSKLPDNLKAHVVQYKQFGSRLGHSFDWARLNRSQTTASFRGLWLMSLEKKF